MIAFAEPWQGMPELKVSIAMSKRGRLVRRWWLKEGWSLDVGRKSQTPEARLTLSGSSSFAQPHALILQTWSNRMNCDDCCRGLNPAKGQKDIVSPGHSCFVRDLTHSCKARMHGSAKRMPRTIVTRVFICTSGGTITNTKYRPMYLDSPIYRTHHL